MLANRTYRAKAFTVQELLVGMVVSSLIIGMVYTIYIQLDQRLLGFQKEQKQIMEFNLFRQVLSMDVVLSKDIRKNNRNELEVHFQNKVHVYRLIEDKMIREVNGLQKDTFNIKVKKIEVRVEDFNDKGSKALLVHTELLDKELIVFESKEKDVADIINSLYDNGN